MALSYLMYLPLNLRKFQKHKILLFRSVLRLAVSILVGGLQAVSVKNNKTIHDHRVSDPTPEDLSKEIHQEKKPLYLGACVQKHCVLCNDE